MKVSMRISGSRSFNLPITTIAQRGFTLVEILVVLFVVTLMTGMVVVSLPSFTRNADFDQEMRRLSLLFDMARSEAELDSLEMGFKRTDKGYKFLIYHDASQTWQDRDAPFQERKLDEDFRLTLKTDEKSAIKLAGDGLPPVLILSSGEITPFTLRLESTPGGPARILKSDGYGKLEWVSNEKR